MYRIIILLLIGGFAHAGGNSSVHSRSDSTAIAHQSADLRQATVVGVEASPEVSAVGGGATIETGAAVGEATATGGNAAGGAASADSTINISEDNPRQAPSVGLVAPPSSATRLKCVGIGGSEERGSALLGWCWKQQDDWARDRHDFLATLGLYTNAAKAYCSKRMHRKDFGTKAKCEAGILQAHYDQASRADNQAFYEGLLKEKDAELAEQQERFNRLEAEVGGSKKPKAPVLLASNNESNKNFIRRISEQEAIIKSLVKEIEQTEDDLEELEEDAAEVAADEADEDRRRAESREWTNKAEAILSNLEKSRK